MQPLARILMIVLVAAFAAGSVAHAASATSIAVKMALAGAGGMNMTDCEWCGTDGDDDDADGTCDLVCVTTLIATVGCDTVPQPPVMTHAAGESVCGFVGRTGPPEPYPPRTLILS